MANLFTCGLHQWAGFQPCPSCDRSQSAPPAAPDVDGLVAALGYQRQIDDDGTECGVSRQAVDEVRTLIVEQRDTITRLASALAEAERERDKLRACVDAADAMREALLRIVQWADAYPEDVFPAVTKEEWKRANVVLDTAGLSLTRISASNMRHVVEGVGKIARMAYEPPDKSAARAALRAKGE